MTDATLRDELDAETRLRVSEIFYSVQGESRPTGLPTVFVRLTGCPLRCVFCDTAYAFHGGQWMTDADILTNVAEYKTPQVCVTGGEPLAQPNCRRLIATLAEAGHEVSIETSGALSIAGLDSRVTIVMDVKTPGSGESDKNMLSNIEHLRPADQVKFVICDRNDYEWSKAFCAEHGMIDRCNVLFSPSHGQLEARMLAEWILADRLQVRFQVQLHKYLWGEEPGH